MSLELPDVNNENRFQVSYNTRVVRKVLGLNWDGTRSTQNAYDLSPVRSFRRSIDNFQTAVIINLNVVERLTSIFQTNSSKFLRIREQENVTWRLNLVSTVRVTIRSVIHGALQLRCKRAHWYNGKVAFLSQIRALDLYNIIQLLKQCIIILSVDGFAFF